MLARRGNGGARIRGWTTEVRHDKAVFGELAEWWDAQRAARVNPFLTTRILGCWRNGIDEPRSRLRVHLLHRRGELVAALPLYSARGRQRSLHKEHTEPFDVIVVDDPEVEEYLPHWLDKLTIAHLYRVPAESPIVAATAEQPGWHVQQRFNRPYVDLSEGFEAVLANMSRNRKSDVRRCRRRLEEMGPVTFVYHPGPGEVDAAIRAGLRLQAEGWKGDHGHAVLNNREHERWYRSVAEVAEDAGWLRVSSLYVDTRLVSFSMGIEFDGVDHGLINAYDESPDVRPLSTGNLLLGEMLAHAAASGTRRCELGSGDDPWKYKWTDKADVVYDLLIFGGATGRAVDAIRSHLQPSQTTSAAG